MAALARHGLLSNTAFLPWKNVCASYYQVRPGRKPLLRPKKPPEIDAAAASLGAKGFLRAQKSYTPPSDLNSKLGTIFNQLFATDDDQTAIQTAAQKFALLHRCSEELQHSVPNSLLYGMKSLGDVRRFYETPVSTITPLDKLKNMELPKNLHVQYDYIRFNPETDTKFNGVTAFPKRSTIVTGIHYKDKYKGHKCEERWPFSLK